MQFKIDENLPVEAADLLREVGYEAKTVGQQGLNGSPDTHVISVCRAEHRTLITLDTDFADIRLYPPSETSGVIVLRLQRQDKTQVLGILRRLLEVLPKEPVQGQLWIVEETSIRVRD
jgi:predicted nuclease of predicted toxin-antitoxin system